MKIKIDFFDHKIRIIIISDSISRNSSSSSSSGSSSSSSSNSSSGISSSRSSSSINSGGSSSGISSSINSGSSSSSNSGSRAVVALVEVVVVVLLLLFVPVQNTARVQYVLLVFQLFLSNSETSPCLQPTVKTLRLFDMFRQLNRVCNKVDIFRKHISSLKQILR